MAKPFSTNFHLWKCDLFYCVKLGEKKIQKILFFRMFQMLQKWNPSKKKFNWFFFFALLPVWKCFSIILFQFVKNRVENVSLENFFFFIISFISFVTWLAWKIKKSLKYVFNLVSHKTSSEKYVFTHLKKNNNFSSSWISKNILLIQKNYRENNFDQTQKTDHEKIKLSKNICSLGFTNWNKHFFHFASHLKRRRRFSWHFLSLFLHRENKQYFFAKLKQNILYIFFTFSHENVFLPFLLASKGSDCLQT